MMNDPDGVTSQQSTWAPPSGAATPVSSPAGAISDPAPVPAPASPTPVAPASVSPVPSGEISPSLPPVGMPTLPPVGAPALPPAAQAPGPPAAYMPGSPPTSQNLPTSTGGELSFDQPAPKGRKSRLAVAGMAAGVIALGVAGVFAVSQLRGGNTGGADSPEAVGDAMMSALEQEDVLGMVDLLLPGERETFRQPMVDMVSELSRLEVLSPDASLGELSGFDIEMAEQRTEVTPTNVDDISNIMMTAKITASLDGDQLPIGDLIIDTAGDEFDASLLDQRATTTDFELPMTVVEQDGRWYLSVFHSIAEVARGPLGEPIPEIGLVPRGGDTPEGAVLALLDGVEQFDLGKIIASINPNEAAALQRYAPLFLDDVEPLLAEIPLTWQITNTEFDVEGSGSKRFVSVSSLRIDGEAEGETFSVTIDGQCAVAEVDGERFDSCELAQGQSSVDDLLGEASESISELTTEFEAVFADYETRGITVQEVDGMWYVSPIGTGFDQVLALMRALDREDLDRLIATTQNVVDDVIGDIAGGFPLPGLNVGDDASSGDLFPDVEIGLDEFDQDAAPGQGDLSTDEGLDEFDAQQRIANNCYALGETARVTLCLADNIAAGALPTYYLTPALEYPECGVAEWALGTVNLAEIPDAEFASTVETASACFSELIAAGVIGEFDVSAEYLRPDCAQGRNPWNFDRPDSDEFFDAWLECVYE